MKILCILRDIVSIPAAIILFAALILFAGVIMVYEKITGREVG